MPVAVEDGVTCCGAPRGQAGAGGSGGAPWEVYPVFANAEMPAGERRTPDLASAASGGNRTDLATTTPAACR